MAESQIFPPKKNQSNGKFPKREQATARREITPFCTSISFDA